MEGRVSGDEPAHRKDSGPGHGPLLLDLVDMVEGLFLTNMAWLPTWDGMRKNHSKLNLQAKGKAIS